MAALIFTVEGQYLERTDEIVLVADSSEYLTASFSFNSDWDGLTKTAVWRYGQETYIAILQDGACTVPHEAIRANSVYVSVFGLDGEALRITTNEAILRVQPSGYVQGETPPQPSPDIYQQIVALMQTQAVDAAAALQAQQSAEAAQGKAEQAQGAAEQAQGAAEQAQEAAETAGREANEAADDARSLTATAWAQADRAKEEADRAGNNILNGVTSHDQSETAHALIQDEVSRVEAIAKGRVSAKVFDTLADMESWLSDPENVGTLNVGDNLYIVDLAVPDYWWDGTQIQELEAQAVNLADYYTKTEVDMRLPVAIEEDDYDYLVQHGTVIAGRIYYVVPNGALGGDGE